MTGGAVRRRDLAQDRRLDAAARHRVRAARVEMAARRRVERRRDLALEGGEVLAPLVEARHLGEQRLRIGMVRRGGELVGRRLPDDAAGIHGGYAVGEALGGTEIRAEEE